MGVGGGSGAAPIHADACVRVSVKAGMPPVDLTVDRLPPRVWVSVEAAVLPVDGIREWQWLGSAATSVGVGGGGSAVSRFDSESALRPCVLVSVEVAVFSVDGIRKWQWIG